MKFTIRSDKARALDFLPSSKADEVMQNVLIIMNTPLGSVPGYRQFGMDMSFMHRPKPMAKTMYVVALNNAIKAFEPRARLENVIFGDAGDQDTGIMNPVLEVTIDE